MFAKLKQLWVASKQQQYQRDIAKCVALLLQVADGVQCKRIDPKHLFGNKYYSALRLEMRCLAESSDFCLQTLHRIISSADGWATVGEEKRSTIVFVLTHLRLDGDIK